jgi:ABC-type uncharacterized transport system ATPase subunit
VSGNGQSELVEALSGQRPIHDGGVFINGKPFDCSRRDTTCSRFSACPKSRCATQPCRG